MRGGRLELDTDGRKYDQTIDVSGKYLVPGFVDLHFHGYDLFDFTSGLHDATGETVDATAETYKQQFDLLRGKLARFGVTGFYLSNFAAPAETLSHCYTQLARFLEDAQQPGTGATLLGGFLEGPFLNPTMAGAMNVDLIKEPSREFFEGIAGNQSIKLAMISPEVGERTAEFIEYLTARGVVVGAGHSNATADQIEQAIGAGLKYWVHFTNGPTGGSYKPFKGGGAVEAVLKSDQLYAELICDGYHVNPAYVRDIIARKGFDHIVGITDCMYIAGSDVTEFVSSGVNGTVSKNGQYLRAGSGPNTLFGSTLTMGRAFNNLLNWLSVDMPGIWNRNHQGMALEESLPALSRVFSTNPCKLTGRDKAGYGTLAEQAIADLCILDINGKPGNYQTEVLATIVAGNTACSAHKLVA